MSTETIPLSSNQSHPITARLAADRLKRGALLYWAVLFTMGATIIHLIGVLVQPPQSDLLVALLLGATIVQAAIAVVVVVVPARRLLLAAAVVEGVALLLWIVAHNIGLPLGFTLWRPETLSVPDLYLPAMESVSAFWFLCLFGRTWSRAPRPIRIALAALPALFILGLLIWAALNSTIATIIVVIFVLAGGIPTSLLLFFLPVVALLVLLLLMRLVFPRLRAMTPGAWRTALILLPALLLVNILTWTGGMSTANTLWFPVPSAIHAPAGQMTTLAYCSPAGNPLAMDLSEPAAQVARPVPMVFFIHGGEGLLGSRTLQDGSLDGMYLTQLRNDLLSRGFAVGSIDYRLAPQHKLTEQVQDAKCAVRFLRAHASKLGINPQRIGVYGFSQGGYLSAMLGTAGPEAGFDVGQYLDQSSRVQAVVDISGFTDVTNFSGSPSWIHLLGAGLSGGATSSSAAVRKNAISPVTYVAPGDPPFLIMHGTDDWLIAPHHSQNMAKLLHAAGVPVTLVMIQHDGHGLDAPTAGQIEQPSPAVLIHMISDFFTTTLAA